MFQCLPTARLSGPFEMPEGELLFWSGTLNAFFFFQHFIWTLLFLKYQRTVQYCHDRTFLTFVNKSVIELHYIVQLCFSPRSGPVLPHPQRDQYRNSQFSSFGYFNLSQVFLGCCWALLNQICTFPIRSDRIVSSTHSTHSWEQLWIGGQTSFILHFYSLHRILLAENL